MIFRSFVSALAVAAIASAAVITAPKHTSTHSSIDHDNNRFVDSSSDLLYTTVKPADNITTVKPENDTTTVKPANNITTVKPAAPVPTQAPMISCYCNLPECLVAAGGDGTCSTRLGCYSEVLPIIPGIVEEIMTPTVTESNKTANGSSVSPIISELVKAPAVVTTEHATAIRGSFGCLDQLNVVKQSCEEILKSMEAESSEFPTMQMPTNTAAPSAADAGVHAFHCCQTERCNGNQSGPAEGSVKSAQAVLVAALNNAFAPHPGVQNSTVGVPWTPAVKSSVNNVELLNTTTSVNDVESSNTKTSVNDVKPSNVKTSANNVQLSNSKKNNAEVPELWLGYFSPLGEPNAPSALISDTIIKGASLIDDTTPSILMARPQKLSVASNQEITQDETVAKVEHVVTKRHAGQRSMSLFDDTTPPILMARPQKLSVASKQEITQDETVAKVEHVMTKRHAGQTDMSLFDDTTPPILMARPQKLSVASKQEITQDETVAKVEHVVTKRHAGQRSMSLFDDTTPPILMARPQKLSVASKQEITQDETVANVEHVVTKRHAGQRDMSLFDDTTPPILMARPQKLSVASKQEITQDETVANVEHVVTKRHAGQRDMSLFDDTTPPILMARPQKLSVASKQEITQDETVANVKHVVTKRHAGQRDISLFDDTTPPILMARPQKLSVASKQEITQDETVANVEHVVNKRHDGQRAVPVLKQTIDDQENIADFDDDIAAEVAAAVATVKSLEITTQQNTVSSGSSGSFSDSWSPRHSGVPDFIPSPSLKKNITTNSIPATRGVNNNSNNFHKHADINDIDTNVIGIICTVVVLCVVGLSVLMIFVLRAIFRKYDVFRNYKGVCSNPGQPCACTGGLTRRRPRTQPSSSHPGAAAAAVNRSASTAPLLPPPNPGHKYRGHGNAGATYNDSIGDTTYVFTKIPVPNHVAPVRVVRR